jgi:fructose-1,6-bisphosphatase/inositol monophosphatase family enzyme
MLKTINPRLILETLLPHLKVAAAYADRIQGAIAVLPAKGEGDNFFAAALTDADLAIQNLVEVALLAYFPHIRFYGEEYERSGNTKYFRAIDLGAEGDYLVTLDPIDGTQFYLDGHSNYQIILSILNWDDFEAVIALSPAQNTYYYALRGEGTFRGTLEQGLAACTPLRVEQTKPTILLGWGMSAIQPQLRSRYGVIDVATDYSREVQISNLNGILNGEIAGAAIKSGKFIDGAALAFLAREAGCIVTTHDGSPLPPLYSCKDYSLPGLLVAASAEVHQHLLEAAQSFFRADF